MFLIENVMDGIKSLWSNKLRFFLPVLSIILGVASLIIILSVAMAEKISVLNQIKNMGADLIHVKMIEGMGVMGFSYRTIEIIKTRYPGVKKVLPFVRGSYLTQSGDKYLEDVVVCGVEAELSEVINIPLMVGRRFNRTEADSLSNICIIGEDVSEGLFKKDYPIGKRLYLGRGNQRIVLRIIGVLKQGASIIELPSKGIIIPGTVFQSRFGDKILPNTLLIQVNESKGVLGVMQQIRGLLTSEKIPAYGYAPIELLIAQENISRQMILWSGCIGGLLLVLGGIGLMNIMLKSTIERTKEIGIRKAIGAKRREIILQFFIECLVIGIIGYLLGLLIGIGGGCILSKRLTGLGIISSWSILISFVATIIVVFISSLYPAYRGASLDPVEALRHEI